LRRRSIPTSHITQLQTALVDGRRQAGDGQLPGVSNSGAAALAGAATTNADPYAQWQQTNAQWQQAPQAYATDYYQQYNNIGYQQQMGQMAYYGGYQQVQMPMYPTMPVAQQMPTMPTMPMAMAASPILPMAGSELLVPPAPDMMMQALNMAVPGFQLPTPLPAPVATATVPAPMPAPLAAAPQQVVAEKKAAPRRRENPADKENAAPAVQRTKGVNEFQKQQHNNALGAPNQRQAI